MKDLKIMIDDDLAISSKTDNIMTAFYIDYQGTPFPDNQWTDLTNAILRMWEHTLLKQKDLCDVKFCLYFMDGPYRLDVSKDKNQQLTVECINSRKDECIELTFKCCYFDFLSALYDASKKFNYLLFCNNMHKDRFEPAYNQISTCLHELKKVLSECNE